jgi:hypothetical protein
LHWASTSSDGASPFVPSPRTLLTNCTLDACLDEWVAASSAPQGHVIGGGASLPVESLHLSTAAVKSTQRGKPKPARVRVGYQLQNLDADFVTAPAKLRKRRILICFGKSEKGLPRVRSSSSQAQSSGPPAQHTVRSRYCTAIDRWRVPHKVAAASFKIRS